MFDNEHSQSLEDFREHATETVERVYGTRAVEVLTINGEPRAVLLSPAAYEALAEDAQRLRDLEAINIARQQIRDGQFKEANAFFGELRAELLEMKAAQDRGDAK